jgi:hypothetical protein
MEKNDRGDETMNGIETAYEYTQCAWCGTTFFKEHARLDGKEKKCPVCGHCGFFANMPKEETEPRRETPEQYEKRAGKPWPENAAVYTICVKNHREFWYPKSLELVKKAGVPLKNVIIATEAGPPPDGWRPEEYENAPAGTKEEGD